MLNADQGLNALLFAYWCRQVTKTERGSVSLSIDLFQILLHFVYMQLSGIITKSVVSPVRRKTPS